MFYRADQDHGLAHNPFKAIVAPRPIGWISTLDKDDRPNLAPYSFFNAVSDDPQMVMFSSGGMKDSARNASDTGEFTCNYVARSLQNSMNLSSGGYPHGENEFEIAGLKTIAGQTVSCPRVAGVPAALECKVVEIITPKRLEGGQAGYTMVVGQVTGVFIDDAFIKDGRFDTAGADPISRCGYKDYAGLDALFELSRPPGAGAP